MDLKEIKQICNNIIGHINSNRREMYYCKYETLLGQMGMSKRINPAILKKLDFQLKKHSITMTVGKIETKSLVSCSRGEIITFKQIVRKITVKKIENRGAQTYKHDNAGTIKISDQNSNITLYKHQEEALGYLTSKIITSKKNSYSGLLVLPTGGGKTLTAAYWLARNYLDKGKKILWIAHRHELLDQAKETFKQKLAYKDVFASKQSFNYRILSGIHDKPVHIKPTDDIIISSKDSLNTGFDYLLKNWIKGEDEIFLVVDEAHHATAKTYRRLIDNIKSNVSTFRMLGLTATPFRSAEKEQGYLAKVFTDDIVYKVDLRTLVTRGILSEPVFEEVLTYIDFASEFSETQLDKINNFDLSSLGENNIKTIAQNSERNHAIVNRYVNNSQRYKQTIVFAVNQDNAIALNALFNSEGVKSEYIISSVRNSVTGGTISPKENKDKIKRFRNGEFDVLINVAILTEGTDLPKVQTIFLARPTVSPIVMTQMIGRGLRGEKAGGTAKAYIVSFVDDWKDKVRWVNPEKLYIEDSIDFNDKDAITREKIIRLISISKIEEFAILADKIIDPTKKAELEKLDFIERIPVGIYHFSILKDSGKGDESAKSCEILVYDNIKQSYVDFIEGIRSLFDAHQLNNEDFLTPEKLDELSSEVEDLFFFGCEKHPAYQSEDIRDVLQYFAQFVEVPSFIELKEREKYNIDTIAQDIWEKDMGERSQKSHLDGIWESHENEWKAFFGYDKKYFFNEIDLATRKMKLPEEYQKPTVVPEEISELRKLEEMSMDEIRQHDPKYWKYLSDAVYRKYCDQDGFYFSATKNKKSKNKLDFQIDHIISRHNRGLTTLDNLQLLTRSENAFKGKD